MADETELAYEPNVTRVLNSREETRSYYNKIAGFYDFMAESAEGPMRDKGLKELALQPGESALEIGFGTGHCLVEMAQAVGSTGQVFGIDISDGMVAQAQELLRKQSLADRVQVVRGDAEKLPYPDASLDAVFTSFTLELFDTPDLPKVLAEVKRVLRPGGRFGVVAVSREGKHPVITAMYEWTHRHFPNLLDCRPIYVRRGLAGNGFTIRSAQEESMWVPVEIVIGVKPT